jgi:hypothetical protein
MKIQIFDRFNIIEYRLVLLESNLLVFLQCLFESRLKEPEHRNISFSLALQLAKAARPQPTGMAQPPYSFILAALISARKENNYYVN